MSRFSPERLTKIRRLRKARRLWKKEPLYAYVNMLKEYPDYTLAEFFGDLKRRTKPKKRFFKSPLPRYGRYEKMNKLLNEYWHTGDPATALEAIKIRGIITQPYRMLVRLEGKKKEFYYDPTISYQRIQELSISISKCITWEQAEILDKEFRETSGFGK